MRKWIFRSAALLLAVGIVTVMSSVGSINDRQSQFTPSEQSATARVRSVNSLQKTSVLIQRLNNHQSIGLIEHGDDVKSHYIERQVTVKFKDHPSEQEIETIERAIDGKLVNRLNTICIFSSESHTVPELIDHFQHDSNVAYVEPNYIYVPNEAPSLRQDRTLTQPNDVLYADYQWNLPMIGADLGWSITKGSDEVVIAVIDTGVDLNHPDLVDRLTTGHNVLTNDDQPDDDHGHGTHVAGIVASQTNNREGIAGITWFSKVMPVKVMDAEGAGTAFDIAKGIMWATDHGADVINLSLGNYQPAEVMEEAVQHAFDQDVVMIAATGNDNTDQPGYPAAYPHVIGVSAVQKDGKRAEFSNFGDYVDVVAPGVGIASTYPGHEYAELSGTSMAAPHVTALAALIRSIYPQLSNTKIMKIIKTSTQDEDIPGPAKYYGNGLIDIASALQMAHEERYPLGQISEWWEKIIS